MTPDRSSEDAQGRWRVTVEETGFPDERAVVVWVDEETSFRIMPWSIMRWTDKRIDEFAASVVALRAEKEQAEAERDRHIAFGADLMRDKVQAEKKAALADEVFQNEVAFDWFPPEEDDEEPQQRCRFCGEWSEGMTGTYATHKQGCAKARYDALERESGGTP